MAISIPIVSEFVGDGIAKARKEFAQLETTGQKAQFALKKAAVPATAALAGLAAGLADATKGAIEDAAAQQKLAGQLERVMGATNAEIKAVEDWISTQGQARAFTDSELRPAFAKLATATADVAESQKLATLAMDIATATGKPLDTVTTALTKAYGGNVMALAKLDPALRDLIKEGMGAQDAFSSLNDTFGGAAAEAAGTAEGSFKRMAIALDETKEGIGAALLPAVEAVLPYLLKFANWAQANPSVFLGIAAAIGAVAAAIVATNIAMALNPFTLIAAGVALLGVALVAAYKKFEGFRNVVQAVVGGVVAYFKTLVNAWRTAINLIIRGINLVKPGKDIPSIGDPFANAESTARGAGIPMMATGGVVAGPTLALIGEQGPEAVVPLSQMGGMGGVTINVHGGDPQAVVDALTRWYRQNGPLPVKVA